MTSGLYFLIRQADDNMIENINKKLANSEKMPFSKQDLHMIKGLRESKNYSSRQFLREFPEKHWTRSGLDKLLRKISVTGSVDRVIGSGRRKSTRTEENVALVGDLIQSQEDALNTHRTTRQISRET